MDYIIHIVVCFFAFWVRVMFDKTFPYFLFLNAKKKSYYTFVFLFLYLMFALNDNAKQIKTYKKHHHHIREIVLFVLHWRFLIERW